MFPSMRDAEQWLTLTEASILRGEWIDPELGKTKLQAYGDQWIEDRKISPRTREEYKRTFRLHIAPFLGQMGLGEIRTGTVRSWRTKLLKEGRTEIRVAKAYRLLRAILHTAVDDERIKRNPCRIKGADQEVSPERPVATVVEVFALADRMPARFRTFVLAAAFTGLRWGELIALRRRDLDLDRPAVRVPRKLAQLGSGEMVEGPTKSAAGVRTVALPTLILADLRSHLDEYVKDGADSLIFVGAKGAILKRGNWRKSVKWPVAVRETGLPEDFRFHDLRHTGNNLAAAAGASTRELMHRMGHASTRAALIYQHATDDRDLEIAQEVSRRALAARAKSEQKAQDQADDQGQDGDEDGPEDGTAGVLVPVG
jgi:integrase